MRKLNADTVKIPALGENERARMFEIMQKYYDATPRDQFERDLAKKNAVIVLRDSKGTIQGFSTLFKKEIYAEGRKAIGIFSGDTIVEKEFWGQRVLGIEFLKQLWLEKARNPMRPVYWFLISKGYKTYLLMANNFQEHYPRFETETPRKYRRMMDDFYSELYPESYDLRTGRILAKICQGKLKCGVAETDEELIKENHRVAFFEKCNPGWRDGDELACVAKMTFDMPLRYQLKAQIRKWQNPENQKNKKRRDRVGLPLIPARLARKARGVA